MIESNSPRCSQLYMSLLLGLSISVVATLVYLATFGHAPRGSASFYVLAAIWTSLAAIAPIWIESLINNGATFQLAVITWRLVTMLGALVIAQAFPSEVRNCFLTTLMACYFVALPLESWLLARNASQ